MWENTKAMILTRCKEMTSEELRQILKDREAELTSLVARLWAQAAIQELVKRREM